MGSLRERLWADSRQPHSLAHRATCLGLETLSSRMRTDLFLAVLPGGSTPRHRKFARLRSLGSRARRISISRRTSATDSSRQTTTMATVTAIAFLIRVRLQLSTACGKMLLGSARRLRSWRMSSGAPCALWATHRHVSSRYLLAQLPVHLASTLPTRAHHLRVFIYRAHGRT